MTCEQIDELLLETVEGSASCEAARQVLAHIDTCGTCRRKYRELRAVLGDLSAARALDSQVTGGGAGSEPARHADGIPLIDDFEIQAEIGRGGMGVVYRARQISLNRVVALKVLAQGLVSSERAVARFHKEAQAAARLHHTNIVPIYAQGVSNGMFYYAMELIEGRPLDQVIRERQERRDQPVDAGHSLWRVSGSLRRSSDYRSTARMIAEVAEGLDHAHRQGVVHRDIKPQNLLLGGDGRLHITDFGLARLLDEPGVTLSSEMVGTPAYMAPEQIAGSRDRIGPHTDVYALGATLYELLSLERPFTAESYDRLLHQILSRDPLPPRRHEPSIPVDLETICLRAIEKEPHRRFSSAAELARDLRRYAEDYPISSRRVGPLGRTLRWVRRRPATAAVIGLVGLLLILAPMLRWALVSYADERLNAAWSLLLEDYIDGERVLAQVDWLTTFAGQPELLARVRALSQIRNDPDTAAKLIEQLVAENGRDADLHYLLAWIYDRLVLSRGERARNLMATQIAQGDACGNATPAGHFFRGMALASTNLPESIHSLGEAIRLGNRFSQAMMHQGRARNRMMYAHPESRAEQFEEARSTLETSCRLQQSRGYPRYLLANTYRLAAESLLHEKGEAAGDEARRLYERSLQAAREAVQVEPTSGRSYVAEAEYHESVATHLPGADARAELRAALAAWERMDSPGLKMLAIDWVERFAYPMRIHFWLGEYELALERMRERFSSRCGYTRESGLAEAAFHRALSELGLGRADAARETLEQAERDARADAGERMLLAVLRVLLGQEDAPPEPPGAPGYSRSLGAGWSEAGAMRLHQYILGQCEWSDVEAELPAGTTEPSSGPFPLAAAHFLHGTRALIDGDRATATAAFEQCSWTRDDETFGFLGKMLGVKLRLDPGWPNWLSARALRP